MKIYIPQFDRIGAFSGIVLLSEEFTKKNVYNGHFLAVYFKKNTKMSNKAINLCDYLIMNIFLFWANRRIKHIIMEHLTKT